MAFKTEEATFSKQSELQSLMFSFGVVTQFMQTISTQYLWSEVKVIFQLST